MSYPVAALDSLLDANKSNLTASVDGESPKTESLVTTRGQFKRNNKRVRFNESVNQYCKRPRIEFGGRQSKTVAVSLSKQQQAATDVAPIVYATASKIQTALPQRSFTVLLDSGSTHTLINKGSLPFGAIPTRGRAKQTTTTMGSFDSSSTALLEEIKFPQFGNCIIGSIKADVFDSPGSRYDIIVGRDILLRMGISLDFQSKVTRWMGHELPMKSTVSIAMDIPSAHEIEQFYQQELEEDLLIMAELFSDEIMDRKYQAVSPEEVVQQLDHLNTQQRTRLKAVFEKYKRAVSYTHLTLPTILLV